MEDLFEPRPLARPVTPEELREGWETSSAYAGVSAGALEDLAGVCQYVHVPRGARLFAQGGRYDCSYSVARGRLRAVHAALDGRPHLHMEIRRGGDVGLVNLIDDPPSLIDLYAVRDSVLVRLSRPDFERVVLRHADVLLNVARSMAVNVRRMIEGSEGGGGDHVVNVALVPASPGLEGVVGSLIDAIEDPVAHVTAGDFDDLPLREERIARLDDLEADHRLVLCTCDATPTDWNAQVLGQADLILLCADGSTTPDVERVRALLPPARDSLAAQRIDLLMVHDPQTTLPSGTGTWLALAPFQNHYHVRMGRRQDFERIGRRLTGRSSGVAMGGGGARGVAHVGVLQALTEAGVPIDIVGGASMGSIFAALWAMGWTSEAMLEKVREVLTPKRALIDFTLPVIALTAGRKLERVLRGLFGETRIEDLWTPFYCTSTSLSQSGPVEHTRGVLWESIRASVALPGIFPPRQSNGDLHVDSAVVDNLPVATMARLCDGGPVIAVDVSDASPVPRDPRYRGTASGWRLLLRKLNPFTDALTLPNLFDLVTRCTVIASRKQALRSRHRAALYLKPPVGDFGTLEFVAHERIYKVGYEYAKARVSEWAENQLD